MLTFWTINCCSALINYPIKFLISPTIMSAWVVSGTVYCKVSLTPQYCYYIYHKHDFMSQSNTILLFVYHFIIWDWPPLYKSGKHWNNSSQNIKCLLNVYLHTSLGCFIYILDQHRLRLLITRNVSACIKFMIRN